MWPDFGLTLAAEGGLVSTATGDDTTAGSAGFDFPFFGFRAGLTALFAFFSRGGFMPARSFCRSGFDFNSETARLSSDGLDSEPVAAVDNEGVITDPGKRK